MKKKKVLKSVAQFFLVWAAVGFVSYLAYSLICKPIIDSYNKYGFEGAMLAVLVEVVMYSLMWALIHWVGKLIDFATD